MDEVRNPRQIDAEKTGRHIAGVDEDAAHIFGIRHFNEGFIQAIAFLGNLSRQDRIAARAGYIVYALCPAVTGQGPGRRRPRCIAAELAAHHVDAQRLSRFAGHIADLFRLDARQGQ